MKRCNRKIRWTVTVLHTQVKMTPFQVLSVLWDARKQRHPIMTVKYSQKNDSVKFTHYRILLPDGGTVVITKTTGNLEDSL